MCHFTLCTPPGRTRQQQTTCCSNVFLWSPGIWQFRLNDCTLAVKTENLPIYAISECWQTVNCSHRRTYWWTLVNFKLECQCVRCDVVALLLSEWVMHIFNLITELYCFCNMLLIKTANGNKFYYFWRDSAMIFSLSGHEKQWEP